MVTGPNMLVQGHTDCQQQGRELDLCLAGSRQSPLPLGHPSSAFLPSTNQVYLECLFLLTERYYQLQDLDH